MWNSLAVLLLHNRRWSILLCLGYLLFMGYWASRVELSFKLNSTLPVDDSTQIVFEQFKEDFGNENTVLILGLDNLSLYQLEHFIAYQKLVQQLEAHSSIEEVLSLANAPYLSRNDSLQRFDLKPLFASTPKTQEELDSLLNYMSRMHFYKGHLFGEGGATLLTLLLRRTDFDSGRRYILIEEIFEISQHFTQQTGIQVRYGGMPYLRYVGSTEVKKDIALFLVLSLLLTLGIFWMIFRSFHAVLPAFLIVLIMTVSVFGTIACLGYKMTLLTGLIPPIVIIIGVTNCVYFINTYHQKYLLGSNAKDALLQTISQIGQISLITNFTTATGFLVLLFVKIPVLEEFGIVAGVNIMMTFVITLALFSAYFSWVKSPGARHIQHAQNPYLRKFLLTCYQFIHKGAGTALLVGGGLIILLSYGLIRLEAFSYIRDDLSSAETLREDLKFFENHFGGVMPLEIVVDTGKKRGFLSPYTQQKIDELEQYLSSKPVLSSPLSINRFVKAARQAYYNGDSSFYALPHGRDQAFVMRYVLGMKDSGSLYNSFVDSTEQKTRISLRVADIGSKHLIRLSKEIEEKIAALFPSTQPLRLHLTGTTLIFTKGNSYLIKNLLQSMLLAFVIIALTMAILFKKWYMVWTSMAINAMPLWMVASIMGWLNISLKPSTAIIFSIAFGIAVDNSIHFLAKYRQALRTNRDLTQALRETLLHTGSSMIYTAIILFAGFFIFTFSSFSGTQTLGLLTSATLALSLLTNLILLPSLLILINRRYM